MFQKPSSGISVPQDEQFVGQQDDVETVVGPSVSVEGDFASEGNIVVKGTVSGTVQTSKKLIVEQGAKIFANVKADTAAISGEVKGNLKVADRLEITGTARILGDIDCQTLVVEAGALISGKITMKGIDLEVAKPGRRVAAKRPMREDGGAAQDMESVNLVG